MLNKFGLAIVMLVAAGAIPAFADDTCSAPTAPAPVDGATLAQPQMVAAIKTVKDFIAASDTYQQCIADYMTAQKADADKNKTKVPDSVVQAEGDKVNANQAAKQKAGDDINASIAAYKKAHPN